MSSKKPPNISKKAPWVLGNGISNGPASRPALNKKLPFFRLPPEIRFIIYRMAWTVDPERHTIKKSGQLRIDYVKEQLSVVTKMGAVSRQMRNEAYFEFFHHTQAYLRWNTQLQGFSMHNVQVMGRMQSSWLLREHLQHLCLHWPMNEEHRSSTFSWLQALQRLETLKIVLCRVPDMGNGRTEWYSEKAMRKLVVCLQGRTAQNGKLFVKFETDKWDLVEVWNTTEWFRKVVKDIAKLRPVSSTRSFFPLFFFLTLQECAFILGKAHLSRHPAVAPNSSPLKLKNERC